MKGISLVSTRKKYKNKSDVQEKRRKRLFLTSSSNWQGSKRLYCLVKLLTEVSILYRGATLDEERSSLGLVMQFKSPPMIRAWSSTFMREEKNYLKSYHPNWVHTHRLEHNIYSGAGQ